MDMKAVLFNIHDVALIVTVVACALLGSRHMLGWRRPQPSGQLFGLFLAVVALVSINTLILWAEPIRHPVFAVVPYLYLFLGVVAFLLGPLLYWQLKSHIDPRFRFGPWQCLHLLPAVLALIYLYLECFRFPHGVQRDLLLNLQLYQQPNAFYGDFVTLKKLLPVIYGALCLRLILRQTGTDGERSDSRAAIRHDQLYIVGGFTAVWLWAAVTHFFGTLRPGELSDVMGIAGNYLNLGLIVFLLYRGAPKPYPSVRSPGREKKAPLDETLVERVEHAMATDKAYLNPQLTLERFAAMIHCTPRDVSMAINSGFHQNFHEFVSSYRIEEVKRNLRSTQYKNWTIADIAQAAGFNSKATFHRFFKKAVGTTPSEYRKAYRAAVHRVTPSSKTA